MSFLNKVGAAVGIGAAGVSVGTDASSYHWGDILQGTVVVTGGSVEQVAGEIQVSLMEHWVTRDNDGDDEHHYRHHNTQTIAREVTLPPQSVQQWSFSIPVPHGVVMSHDWYAHARVCVPRAVDRTGQAAFDMLPPASLMGLGNALCEALPMRLSSRGNSGARAILDFAPGDQYKQYLDGVKLVFAEDGEQLRGFVEVNPQERSFADRLKALARADRVKHELTFAAEPLRAAENGPAPGDVVEQLRQLLAPYLR